MGYVKGNRLKIYTVKESCYDHNLTLGTFDSLELAENFIIPFLKQSKDYKNFGYYYNIVESEIETVLPKMKLEISLSFDYFENTWNKSYDIMRCNYTSQSNTSTTVYKYIDITDEIDFEKELDDFYYNEIELTDKKYYKNVFRIGDDFVEAQNVFKGKKIKSFKGVEYSCQTIIHMDLESIVVIVNDSGLKVLNDKVD